MHNRTLPRDLLSLLLCFTIVIFLISFVDDLEWQNTSPQLFLNPCGSLQCVTYKYLARNFYKWHYNVTCTILTKLGKLAKPCTIACTIIKSKGCNWFIIKTLMMKSGPKSMRGWQRRGYIAWDVRSARPSWILTMFVTGIHTYYIYIYQWVFANDIIVLLVQLYYTHNYVEQANTCTIVRRVQGHAFRHVNVIDMDWFFEHFIWKKELSTYISKQTQRGIPHTQVPTPRRHVMRHSD